MTKWTVNRISTELPLPRGANEIPLVPPPGLDEPAPSPPKTPQTRRVWMIVAGVAVAAAITVWALASRRSASSADASGAAVGETVRTAEIVRGDFVRSMRFHGTVEPVEANPVVAPRLAGQNLNTLVITYLAPPGSAVKPGDLLVEFDRQAQIQDAFDRQSEYKDFLEQIKKKQASEAAAKATDDTDIKQAEDALGTAQLEMKKNEVISKIDAEKNQEALAQAQANLKQLQETYRLKREAAAAAIKVLEIQRDRSNGAMVHAQKNSEKMSIRAAHSGLVVLNSIWKGQGMDEVQVGDEVRAGLPFMQVVNPAAMRVRVRVNQVDVPYLAVGQPCQIRLDAYPDLVFPGKLETLSAIGVQSSLSTKVHTFVATFSISGNDPKLMPDLSAAVDVELERKPGVLLAPRDAIIAEAGHEYVRVKNGAGFERREVKAGEENDVQIVIESGAQPGAVVLRGAELASGQKAGEDARGQAGS